MQPYLPISYFQDHLPDSLALLGELVAIESPSTDKAAVDLLSLRLQAEAEELGAVVERLPRGPVGDILVCRWNPSSSAAGLLLLAHMDTVYDLGTLAGWPIPSTPEELRGPGVLDMKGGIASALQAIRALAMHGRLPNRPITLLLNSDEEIGSLHSRAVIEAEARKAGAEGMVFCLEPAMSNGAVKTWRKGTGDILLSTKGVAAHAGASHEQGRNAIEELAHHILSAQRLTDYTRGTTVNVGVVRGGTRGNVVPDSAEAQIDFRIVEQSEIQRLQAWVDGLQAVIPGTVVSATLAVDRPPMPRDARMAASFGKAQSIAAQLGLELREGGTGGGSDANFIAPLDVPVLDGLGPIGDGAHTEREHVRVFSIPERTALLAALLAGW
jgi:glutamate carboxypeptidase